MLASIILAYSKKYNKDVSELEKLWDKAKQIAAEEGHANEYDYIVGIFKRMVGVKEMKDSVIREALKRFYEEQWAKNVDPKWTPPEGTFTEDTPANKTAEIVCKASSSLKQAVSRVNFYFNRCGEKCPDGEKRRENILKELHNLCK